MFALRCFVVDLRCAKPPLRWEFFFWFHPYVPVSRFWFSRMPPSPPQRYNRQVEILGEKGRATMSSTNRRDEYALLTRRRSSSVFCSRRRVVGSERKRERGETK